ncbi:helix-turn-helix domain-containing protein [Pseudooceanicola nitratireducens]|uniref:helix-turn-helix domain-containing protein n=1 Tax=Pseudooceanicola nitratireducens TaxID=517719 RepID=UPI001C95A113|nr:helix-turn-helix domain-containing protein [Pseudooceanicola nitratireducens]MBY6159215.1 helix-turn-helix domain-containing protein [Pseudooceanicola nitratireducens]
MLKWMRRRMTIADPEGPLNFEFRPGRKIHPAVALYDEMKIIASVRTAEVIEFMTRRPGKVSTYDDLANVIDSDMTPREINFVMGKVRKWIRACGLPIEIISLYGIGYAAEFTDPDFALPWRQQGLKPQKSLIPGDERCLEGSRNYAP